MIKSKHLATAKLQTDSIRLSLEMESNGLTDFECELVIELSWLLGRLQEIPFGNYYLQKKIFHIEVPDNVEKKTSKFNWQLINLLSFNGIYSRLRRTGKMSPINLYPYLITTFTFLITHLVKQKNVFQL